MVMHVNLYDPVGKGPAGHDGPENRGERICTPMVKEPGLLRVPNEAWQWKLTNSSSSNSNSNSNSSSSSR